MLPIVAAIVASTAAGAWAEHRYGGRAGLAARRGMLVALYGVLPPVVFFNIARAEIDLNAGAGIALAFVSLGLLGLLAWVLARRVLQLRAAAVGSFVNAAIAPNTGYLGYPVVAALLGFDALSEAAAFDVLVSSPVLLLAVFAIGAAFGDRAGEGLRERVLAFFTRNPPLYAAIAGVLAPDALAPDLLVDASRIAVMAVLPLGFFAVGAVLAEEAEGGRIGFPPPLDAPVTSAVALRLLAGPALLFALAAPLIDLPATYLLLAAMPTGLNTMIVAHAYGLDLRIAAGTIAWSTAIAVVVLAVGAAVW